MANAPIALTVEQVDDCCRKLLEAADGVRAASLDVIVSSTQGSNVWTQTEPPADYRGSLGNFTELAVQVRDSSLASLDGLARSLRNYANTMFYVIDPDSAARMDALSAEVEQARTVPPGGGVPGYQAEQPGPAAPGGGVNYG